MKPKSDCKCKTKRVFCTMLAVLMLLPGVATLASCGKVAEKPADSSDDTGTSPPPAETSAPQDKGPVSDDGIVELRFLGTKLYDSLGESKPADGNVFAVVYAEAVNKTPDLGRVYTTCLSSRFLKDVFTPDEYPEGCEPFGGFIASGTRKLFCFCLELEAEWYNIVFEYVSPEGQTVTYSVRRRDLENEVMLTPATEYPMDTTVYGSTEENMKVLIDAYEAGLWGTPNEGVVNNILSVLEKTDKGTKFTTVNYASQSASSWDVRNHLLSLSNLISAYGKERIHNDAEARETVFSILDYWLNNDFTCSVNWWYNEIGIPKSMLPVGFMLRDLLDDARMEKIDEIIGRGTLRGSSKATTKTGANLADVMMQTVQHALLINDEDLLCAAVARMAQEVRITAGTKEGIKEDYTFYQHGPQLGMAGSYGAVFIQNIAGFIWTLAGTPYAFPQRATELFVDSLLEGHRYFHRKDGTAYFAIGRSAVYASGAASIRLALKDLIELDDIPRKAELENYYKSFADNSAEITDTRYFPYGYTLASNAPGYYMAVKGAHSDFVGTEVVNRQNMLGYNYSYGADTCFMYNGTEYSSVGVAYDFAMIPGTTAYHENDTELMSRFITGHGKNWGGYYSNYNSDIEYCNGATAASGKDGEECGVLYMQLKNDGIGGTLSFITRGGLFIALGTDLSCTKEGNSHAILTTLDQCLMNNPIYDGNALAGENVITGDLAVKNGVFAYYNLGDGALNAYAGEASGTYVRTDSARSDTTPSVRNVFKLWIDHGTGLDNTAYAYAVAANEDGNAPSSASGLGVKVASNTPALQAVEFEDGGYAVVFHAAGSYTTASGKTVSGEAGSIVIG